MFLLFLTLLLGLAGTPLATPAATDGEGASAPAPAADSAGETKTKVRQARKKKAHSAAAADAVKSDATASATPQAQPLRFTDDDLKSLFHKPTGSDEEDAADAEEKPQPGGPAGQVPAGKAGAPQATGQPTTPGSAPGTKPPAKPVAKARPKPTPVKPPAPPADPLKAYHEREAMEKFRTEQIETLRAQIAQGQARLDYLNQKRLAILNPYNIMPQPQGDEERQQEAREKPKELLAQVDEEIKKTEEDLAELKTSLVRIETRFQGEAGPR